MSWSQGSYLLLILCCHEKGKCNSRMYQEKHFQRCWYEWQCEREDSAGRIIAPPKGLENREAAEIAGEGKA